MYFSQENSHVRIHMCTHTHTHIHIADHFWDSIQTSAFFTLLLRWKLSRVWCLCWTLCYRPGNSWSCVLICLSLGLSSLNNHRTYMCKMFFPWNLSVPIKKNETQITSHLDAGRLWQSECRACGTSQEEGPQGWGCVVSFVFFTSMVWLWLFTLGFSFDILASFCSVLQISWDPPHVLIYLPFQAEVAEDEDAWDDESTESSDSDDDDDDDDDQQQRNDPGNQEKQVEEKETGPANSGEDTGVPPHPMEPPVARPGKGDDVASKVPVAKGEGSSSSAGSSTVLICVSVQLRLLQNTSHN